ncbi:ATP-dependent zinc protease [Polaribacter tangerinus]|uniref:ATP-dependent zinc protease family protein n=1 Tax=Polaribacter tangerinus TaxID=1920034 RepID=UPI000B4BB800|nr:RimK/LysX family protein [Polaribacter tangerinus]
MKITIGREDKADFPEFLLENIDVKIDSGAYTSSIHCTNIEEIEVNNKKQLKFTLLDPAHTLYNNKEFITNDYTFKIVKSSNGISERRFRILTEIIMFNKKNDIYLTLTERKNMKFPILLGRKFLNKKFVIDTTKKNLSYHLKHQE